MPMMTPYYWQFVHKTADRPAVAASLYGYMARIQEWCNHWSMILNPNKTKASVVSRSKTVNPPHGDLVLSGVPICASPNLDILGVKFDSRLTFKDHVCGIISRVSQRIGILRLVKCEFVDTSVLLRCYYAFVLRILQFCSAFVFSQSFSFGLFFGVLLLMSSAASRASGIFSGQALP